MTTLIKNKTKFQKKKLPRAKRALSWSEILARIEWFVNKKKNVN